MRHRDCKAANAKSGSSPGLISAGMAQGILLCAADGLEDLFGPLQRASSSQGSFPLKARNPGRAPLGKSHTSQPEGRLPAKGTAQRLLGIYPARLQGQIPHIQTEGCRQTKTGRIALALPPGWLAAGPPVSSGFSSRPGMPLPELWPWAGEGGRQRCGSGPAPSPFGSPGSCSHSGASSCRGPGGVSAAWSSFRAQKNPTPETEERTGRGPAAPRHMEGSLSSSHLSWVVGLHGKLQDATVDDRPESQAPSCACVAAGGLMKPELGLGGCCEQREKDRPQADCLLWLHSHLTRNSSCIRCLPPIFSTTLL